MFKPIIYLIIGLAFVSCSTCMKVAKWWQVDNPDNEIEESVEDFIKDKTGYDIDLTPISGEETQTNLKDE